MKKTSCVLVILRGNNLDHEIENLYASKPMYFIIATSSCQVIQFIILNPKKKKVIQFIPISPNNTLAHMKCKRKSKL